MNRLHFPWNLSTLPESWPDVRAFAHWWSSVGCPIITPSDAEVYCTDDATSVPIFRLGQFQIEMYLIHPDHIVEEHEHPGVEVIQMRMQPQIWGFMSPTLVDGESHGPAADKERSDGKNGYPILAFEHWKNVKPTTVAAMWKGKTVGPRHEALIRRFNPDAFVVSGYADITRSKQVKAA